MSLESVKSFFETGGVVLLFLTFVFGTGALFTSNRINKAQEEKLRVFDAQLTEARTGLAKQQERAALAETALAEVRQQLEHRHLTPKQRAQLVELLKTKPKGTVLLTCPMNNTETADYMAEIGDTLKEAGWGVARDIPRIFPTTPIGIELSVARNDVPNPAVEAFDDALETIGMVIAKRSLMPDLGTDIRILVGANPQWAN